MIHMLPSIGCGLLFGAGLLISGMANPETVIGFLDVSRIPAGNWDPSLLWVMTGALSIYLPLYLLLIKKRVLSGAAPLCADRYHLPSNNSVDKRLVLGAALFGLGWGVAGICPGPSITALGFGSPAVIYFVIAMLAGIYTVTLFNRRQQPGPLGRAH